MIKATLLLHFYRKQKFLGQKMLWTELGGRQALFMLIASLAQARQPKDLRPGTEEFKQIKDSLEQAFDKFGNDPDWKEADSVRVMQMFEGWPFKMPDDFLSTCR